MYPFFTKKIVYCELYHAKISDIDNIWNFITKIVIIN